MKAISRKITAFFLAVIAVFGILSGCAPAVEDVPADPTETPASAPTPAPTPEPTPEPTPVPRSALDYEARELSGSMTVTIAGRDDARRLTDANYNTKLLFSETTEIVISAEEEISGLYMIWDKVPGLWSVRADSFTVNGGEHGFLHEFVELPEGAKSFTLHISKGVTLCDIYAFTDGRLPEYVQLWTYPVERADILLFPTHGDDELLFFGPILPIYAGELGLSVQVVYLTHHWAEPYRPHEQLNGLWSVGVTAYPIFGVFKDRLVETLNQALRKYNADSVIEFQVEMIRRFQPQVIVGHAEKGEYGHGMHILNTRCLEQAVEYAADENYNGSSLKEYGVWDTPKLYLHLYQENNISLDYDQPLEHFGGRTAFEMAKEGYGWHLSQHQWAFRVYPKGSSFDCSSFGLYRSTVGEDVEKNDLMENLLPYSSQSPALE